MENLGALALLLAFCLSIYSVAGSLVGRWKRNKFLMLSAERAILAVWLLITTAAGTLLYALLTDNFRLYYVASNSNKAMPAIYKFTAWWGGQQGSLLFWSWLLATYSFIVVLQNRRKFRDLMPYVIAVLGSTLCFFLVLNCFVVNPFQVLVSASPQGGAKMPITLPDGNGLNPLLQYWAMAIHPPMLYLGYVGFIVPFAFALGSMVTKQPGEAWIHTTRRWSLVTWLFQTSGIILGSGWAYSVLGWGGYWAWDPVENASFLPWLTATAFLHSVMMQEKKGMMKVWNMVLISCTFFLCIFGTFLTRSGVVSSVHAFAQSPLGGYFVVYLGIGITITTVLILNRLDFLKPEARLESVVSRESSFMFNNLILVASCFSILWGTLFPIITEKVTGEKVSVGAEFYNRVNIPVGLFLLFLTGVGPLIAWRRSSTESLKKAFLWPSIAAGVLLAGLFASGMRHPYALVSFALCLFVLCTILTEFWKGAAAISSKSGSNIVASMIELTHRNTRRYGGYLVHLGIVAMFIGFTGAAFNKDAGYDIVEGSRVQLGNYGMTVRQIQTGENDNYSWQRATIDVTKNGQSLDTLYPERRFFKAAGGQPASEVAIRRRLNEDFYVNFAGKSGDNSGRYILQAYEFPLVSWIWIGYAVVLFGTLICLVPSKVRLQYPRTQVVGVGARNNVPVEQK